MLRFLVPCAREGEDAAPLMARDLSHDVRRRAEAVQPESFGFARRDERAVADQPRAQQGSGLEIGVLVGQREAERRVRHRIFGVAAVDLVAREARPITQILPSRAAVAALTAAPTEPGHPHAVPDPEAIDFRTCSHRDDGSHDLVPEDERQLGVR